MWIFYRHLPRGVTTKEIQRVTQKGAYGSWSPLFLFAKPKIKRSKIIRIRDPQTESIEYHAIVQVDSPITADTIIQNLDGKTVNGLFLKPHRYYRRFSNRDRRINHDEPYDSEERRATDRRRRNLVTHVLDIA
jgi:hypothetical protein